MDRNFLAILIVVGVLILARRKIDWHQVVMDNRWLLLLFLYMLVSITWSDYPFVSLKRWIKAFGGIVMALVVLTGPSPFKEIESIFRRTIYILIPFSALLIKYFPSFGVRWGRYSGLPLWAGVTNNKNSLGTLCIFSVLFLIWTWAKRRKQTERLSNRYEDIAHVVVLGLSFWLLKGSGYGYSATAIAVLIIGLATLFVLRHVKDVENFRFRACLILVVTGLAYLFMRKIISVNPVSVVASLMGRSDTLTGRDEIWGMLIPVAMKNAVLGLGYGGFWIHPLEFDKFTVNQAHNGYLDVFIQLGAVGLILLAIVIVAFFKNATDVLKYDIEWGSFLLMFLVISLLYNITESSFLMSTIFVWNVLLMLMVACPTRKEPHVVIK